MSHEILVKPTLIQPSPTDIRKRIDAIPNKDSQLQDLFRLEHFGPRVGELCFPKPSDFYGVLNPDAETLPKTGHKSREWLVYPIKGTEPLRASDLTYVTMQPNRLPMEVRRELAGWAYYYNLTLGQAETERIMREFFTSEYPGLCIRLRTEKRKTPEGGHIQRDVVIPEDPRFEPWAPHIERRILSGDSQAPDKAAIVNGAETHFRKLFPAHDYVFPVLRSRAYFYARRLFGGLGYEVKGVMKPLSNHGNRHWAEDTLKREYGFSDFNCESMLGHTHSKRSAMHDIYGSTIKEWELYFPKFILTKMLNGVF